MRRSGHLDPQEQSWAVAHALEVHRLDERRRQDLENCISYDQLRQVLLELGVPQSDVDASLATLDAALRSRHKRRASRRRWALLLAVTFALTAGLGFWYALPAHEPQHIFINIFHSLPGQAGHHSWTDGEQFQGESEGVLVEALQKQQLGVIQHLPPKVVRRLFVGGAQQPSQAALLSVTETGLTLLGRSQCAQTAGLPNQGPTVARAQLSIKVRWPGDDTPLRQHQGEAEARGDSLQAACEHASAAAAATFAQPLALELAKRLHPGRPPNPTQQREDPR